MGQFIILHLQISVYGILFCKHIALLIVFICMRLNAIWSGDGRNCWGSWLPNSDICKIHNPYPADSIGKWEKWLVFTQLCKHREKKRSILHLLLAKIMLDTSIFTHLYVHISTDRPSKTMWKNNAYPSDLYYNQVYPNVNSPRRH